MFTLVTSDQVLERLHHDLLAGSNTGAVGVKQDKTVGLAHGAQDTGTLATSTTHSKLARCSLLQHTALEFKTAGAFAQGGRRLCAQRVSTAGSCLARHFQQRRARKLEERHHDGDRIARQAKYQRAVC